MWFNHNGCIPFGVEAGDAKPTRLSFDHPPPRAGLRGIRSPCMYVARMCLFDRAHHRFLGNVMGFKPQAVLGNDAEWIFDQKVCGWRDVGYKLGHRRRCRKL